MLDLSFSFFIFNEIEFVTHLNARGLTLFDRLEQLIAGLTCRELESKLLDILLLTLNSQILHREFEACRKSLVCFTILEVENCTLGSIIKLVESI